MGIAMTSKEFKAEVAALPPLPPKAKNAPRHSWPRNRYHFRKRVRIGKPEEMLRWPEVYSVMFVGHQASYIPAEYKELKMQPDWDDIELALSEPCFGDPPLYENWTSGNLVHQMYHLRQWEMATGKRIRDMSSIFEFGGGYGAMALLTRQLGFEGDYYLYDFPEFLLLQEYYLSNTCGVENIHFIQEEPWTTCDLFIGCYSISEAPAEIRESVLGPRHRSFLMVIQPSWEDVNNNEYFDNFMQEREDLSWVRLRSYLIS